MFGEISTKLTDKQRLSIQHKLLSWQKIFSEKSFLKTRKTMSLHWSKDYKGIQSYTLM